MKEDGISADVLDSVIARNKLALLTTQEDVDLGVDASLAIALGWTYFGSVDYYPVYEQAIDDLTEDRAAELIRNYLADNLHRAVSVTKPVAGLTEQNAKALETELAEKKAAMTAEEIDKMVESTSAFLDWANTPVSSDIMSEIANTNIADLPEEIRHYEIEDNTIDGVRYLSTGVNVPGVFSSRILLDGSTIPVDKLQDVQACLWLMGELDTTAHSKEALSMLIARYLANFSSALTTTAGYQGKDKYSAQFRWEGLAEDADASTALLQEILFETDYSDTATIRSLLTRWKSDFVNNLNNYPLQIQLDRCMAMYHDCYAYNEYVDNYDMTVYMQTMIALADSNPAELTRRLTEARTLVLNRADATVLLAGSEDAIASYGKGIEQILTNMTNEKREKVDYSSLRIPKRNEGVVVNSTVQMNVAYHDYQAYNGQDEVLVGLIDDMYMLPTLRNALGAYGAYSNVDRTGAYLYTYRDPNLAGSYDIFAKLPEYLEGANLTQADVDSYIIGSYSRLSRPMGLLSGATRAMMDSLTGCSEELRMEWMKQAKAVTPESLAASVALWSTVNEDGVRSTSGTESALLAAGDLFDVLLYPDGTVKELPDAAAPAA